MTFNLPRRNLFCFGIYAPASKRKDMQPRDLIKYFGFRLSSQIFPEGRSSRGRGALEFYRLRLISLLLSLSLFLSSIPTVFSQRIHVENERLNPAGYTSLYLCVTIQELEAEIPLKWIDNRWKFMTKDYESNWYLFRDIEFRICRI